MYYQGNYCSLYTANIDNVSLAYDWLTQLIKQMLCFYSQRKLKVRQYSMIKGATLKLGKLQHLICVNHNMLLNQLAHHMCKLIVSKPNIVWAIPLCLMLSHLYRYWINEIDHFSCFQLLIKWLCCGNTVLLYSCHSEAGGYVHVYTAYF